MTNLVFAVGLAIGPQVVKPYLGHYPDDEHHHDDAGGGGGGIEPIQMAYLVLAVIDLFMAILLTLTAIMFALHSDQCASVRQLMFHVDDDDDIEVIPDESDDASSEVLSEVAPTKLDPCSRPGRVLVALIVVAFMMVAGQCLMFACLLYTYLYEYLHWSVDASTRLYSIYYSALFLVGAIIVPVSRWVSPTKLIVMDMSSLLLSSVLMFTALRVESGSDILTATGVMVSAVGDSNILPTFITLAEQSLYVIPRVMSLFMAAFGGAIMVLGPVAGVSLNYSVESYPTLLLALVLASLLILVAYFGYIRWLKISGQWPTSTQTAAPAENDRQNYSQQ